MSIADSVAPRFEMGRVVRRTFSVIANNLVTFALLSLITAIPAALWNWVNSQSPGEFQFDFRTIGITAGAWLAFLISAFVLQAAVVHGTVADLNGRRAPIGACISTGFRHFLPLIGIALLYGLYVGVGLILLIVPGIIIAVMMSVAVPARVVEHTGVMVAFDRSQELTIGHRWPIFGLFVAYFILQATISTIIFSITGLSFATAPTPEGVARAAALANTWPVILASTLASMINGVLSAAGTASIYYELRQIKEGVGPEALASVFD